MYGSFLYVKTITDGGKRMKLIKKKGKTLAVDLLYDFLGSILYGVGIHCFIEPCSIAPGGASGLAILLNQFINIPIGTWTLLINIPLLFLAYFHLGKKFTIKTLKTVLITTIVLDGFITPNFPQYIGDRLIGSAFGGIFLGLGLVLIFMRGSTTGGADIAGKLLQKRFPYMQIGHALNLIDFVVIALSVLVFRNIESALYGIISMVCTNQSIDMIIYGKDKGTMVTIISPKNEAIAEAVMDQLGRGATFLKSRGAYGKQETETLFCVVDKRQFYEVKGIIDEIDPRAFVIVSETKEIYGEGFKEGDRD